MSEIYYLFGSNEWLNQLDEIKMLSIGCGPSSELFGVARYLFDTNQNKSISYTGFDLNAYWNPIHEHVAHRANRSKLDINYRVHQKNIFDIYKHGDKIPSSISSNILIFQYLLSDMASNNEDVNKFLELTKEYIVKRMDPGSIVIINDINLDDIRQFYNYFYRILGSEGDYNCKFYHFRNNNREFFPYGLQHARNNIVIDIPDCSYQYNVWTFCSSSQMVIIKNN